MFAQDYECTGYLLSIVPTNYTHYFSIANADILNCAPAYGDNTTAGLDWVSVDLCAEIVKLCKQSLCLGTETSFEY